MIRPFLGFEFELSNKPPVAKSPSQRTFFVMLKKPIIMGHEYRDAELTEILAQLETIICVLC
jgi:hypothetical protein